MAAIRRNINEFTAAVLEVKEELDSMRKKANKGTAIPFMEERVRSRVTAANRFKELGPDEKRAVIERDGIDAVMKMLGLETPPVVEQAPIDPNAPTGLAPIPDRLPGFPTRGG